MKSEHGKLTREIGETLAARFRSSDDIEVFYDHGDTEAHIEVCQPTTYMGRRYGSDATLSGLDVAILFKKKIILIIELEEGGARPKTLLGDVFGVVLANNACIKKRSYKIKNVSLILGVVTKTYETTQKMYRLERLLNKHLTMIGCSAISKVRIIPTGKNDLVRRIERLIRNEVTKKSKQP